MLFYILVYRDDFTFRDDFPGVSVVSFRRKIIPILANHKLLPAYKVILLLVLTEVNILDVFNLPFVIDGNVP